MPKNKKLMKYLKQVNIDAMEKIICKYFLRKTKMRRLVHFSFAVNFGLLCSKVNIDAMEKIICKYFLRKTKMRRLVHFSFAVNFFFGIGSNC